jgi:hypothetical protein
MLGRASRTRVKAHLVSDNARLIVDATLMFSVVMVGMFLAALDMREAQLAVRGLIWLAAFAAISTGAYYLGRGRGT